MSKTYELNVEMTCGGCSKAVSTVLGKTKGVDNVVIDLPNKLVTVTASGASLDDVLAAVKRTGKAIHSSKEL